MLADDPDRHGDLNYMLCVDMMASSLTQRGGPWRLWFRLCGSSFVHKRYQPISQICSTRLRTGPESSFAALGIGHPIIVSLFNPVHCLLQHQMHQLSAYLATVAFLCDQIDPDQGLNSMGDGGSWDPTPYT